MKQLFLVLIIFCLSCQVPPGEKVDIGYELIESDLWSIYTALEDKKDKNIILISGDEEYRSEEVLPEMARILSSHHGYDCTVLYSQDPVKPGIVDPNYSSNIPGLSQLEAADLMIIFTRFRSLPDSQMIHIDRYLKSGKPVVAARTATHAFNYSDTTSNFAHYGWNYEGSKTDWHLGFGKRILGETWYTHHGHHKHQSTRGRLNMDELDHPILSGISDSAVWGATDVYGVRQPLGDDVTMLVYGQSIDRSNPYDENDLTYGMRQSDSILSTSTPINSDDGYNPNADLPPIAWLKSYQIDEGLVGKSFTSTIGASTDFLDEDVRRLLINAVYYMSEEPVPTLSNVSLSANYIPSQFAFRSDAYWDSLNIIIKEIR